MVKRVLCFVFLMVMVFVTDPGCRQGAGPRPGSAAELALATRPACVVPPECAALTPIPTSGAAAAEAVAALEVAANERGPCTDPAELARTDPLALLELARRRYDESVHDYTVILVKQERDDDGTLGDVETLWCKFREAPLNIFLAWREGAGRIDKALYCPTVLGPDVLVHPTGLAGLLAPVVRISFSGEHAEAAARIKDFGFRRMLARLIDKAASANGSRELVSTFLGETVVCGRPALGLEWRLPPDRGHQYGRIVIQLCRETLLPLTVAMWNWQDELQARYVYRNVQLNVNLSDEDFSKDRCGLKG